MTRQPVPVAEPVVPDLEAFTVQEVAARLRVHEDWVYDRVRNGELGHIRGGGRKSAIRILPSQLSKFIDARRVE
jgi:excisionase family DNA binding protein